jgi:hypothetical protein
MTVSILDVEELKKVLFRDETETVRPASNRLKETPAKPVSGLDLVERAKGLFTPEEADALAHRIEESCEQLDD